RRRPARAGRLDGRAAAHRGAAAAARHPRTHPRVRRRAEDRCHALHQPRQRGEPRDPARLPRRHRRQWHRARAASRRLMTATPLGDIIAEADRMLAAAHERNVRVRLIGGLAVYFHADHVHPALARPYGDIDVATTKAEGRDLTELMTDLGYEPARQ